MSNVISIPETGSIRMITEENNVVVPQMFIVAIVGAALAACVMLIVGVVAVGIVFADQAALKTLTWAAIPVGTAIAGGAPLLVGALWNHHQGKPILTRRVLMALVLVAILAVTFPLAMGLGSDLGAWVAHAISASN